MTYHIYHFVFSYYFAIVLLDILVISYLRYIAYVNDISTYQFWGAFVAILCFSAYFATKRSQLTEYPYNFPNKCVTAYMKWEDLITAEKVSTRLNSLKIWQGKLGEREKSLRDSINMRRNEILINRCTDIEKIIQKDLSNAKNADKMSYDEFKQAYPNVTQEQLNKIFQP